MSSPADSPQDASPSSPYPLERADSDPDTRPMLASRPPSTASSDFAPQQDGQARLSRSLTGASNFVSSPLNPNPPTPSSNPPFLFPARGGQSKQNMVFNRIPSEESQALASQRPTHTPNRTSMILYRLADDNEQRVLTSPNTHRQSVLSNSGDSVFTVSYDSKYPSGAHTPHMLVAYPFDPSSHINTPEDDDALHDPMDDSPNASSGIPIRGLLNVGVLVLVIVALLCLFIFYPIWHYVIQGKGS